MNQEELRHLVALTFVDDVGPVAINSLLGRFGSPRNVFRAPASELSRVSRLSNGLANRIVGFSAWKEVDHEIEKADRAGVTLLTFDDDRYPPLLRHIYDYPPLLYVKGSLERDAVNVAVVGSRRSTAQGRYNCDRICRELAARGITIVSGMARGIDTAAHRGALASRGRTVAVLGTGIDVIYPAENGQLYEKIASEGAVVTEYPFGATPQPHNFPRRNRIISGVSFGVLVVEAAEKSGSLITARMALEQGREVFAIPGGIEMNTSRGTNGLIQSGARLVQDAEDIISEIQFQLERAPRQPEAALFPAEASQSPEDSDSRRAVSTDPRPEPETEAATIPEDQKTVLGMLSTRPLHLDILLAETDLTINRLLDILLALEMKGLIRQMPGRYFAVKE